MRFIKRHKVLTTFLLILFIIFFGLIGGVFWVLNKDNVDIVSPDDVDPTADQVKIAEAEQKDKDVFNILLVGTDTRDPDADMGRYDSMMLVSFNKRHNIIFKKFFQRLFKSFFIGRAFKIKSVRK